MVCLKILFVSSLDPIMERVGNDRQSDGWYSNELEEAGEDGGDEVEELVEEGNVHPAENGTKDEGSYPKCELTPLGKGIVAGHDVFSCVFDMGLVFLGHNGLPFFFEKMEKIPPWIFLHQVLPNENNSYNIIGN